MGFERKMCSYPGETMYGACYPNQFYFQSNVLEHLCLYLKLEFILAKIPHLI